MQFVQVSRQECDKVDGGLIPAAWVGIALGGAAIYYGLKKVDPGLFD
jgi:hypothetical protein